MSYDGPERRRFQYWRQWIPRWQLLTAYGLIVVAAVVGFVRTERNFMDIDQLRRERVLDLATADRRLCERVNASDRVLIGIIEGVRTLPPRSGDSPERLRERDMLLRQAIDRLRPVNCAALPSQRPFRPR